MEISVCIVLKKQIVKLTNEKLFEHYNHLPEIMFVSIKERKEFLDRYNKKDSATFKNFKRIIKDCIDTKSPMLWY